MAPRVLSLTPPAILTPVHATLRPSLGPHELAFAGPADGDLEAALAVADFIIGDWTHCTGLDAARLARATRCRAVFQPAAGVEEIDLEAAAALGLPVATTPGANAGAVAEWTVMAALALLKDVWRHDRGVRAGRWDMVEAAATGVYEIAGRAVGIVGLGHIGREVARRFVAFGVRLLYADSVAAPPEVEAGLDLERV
jgi:phosphoglycerate dehydrogenase-like enzyme